VHYNPWTDPRLIVKYSVIDASTPTQLYTYFSEKDITVNGAAMFDKVVIDGTEMSIANLDSASGQIQLSAGEHTVKYTLKDPTFIGEEFDEETETTRVGATFSYCGSITSVEIPNSVTSIGNTAFQGCSGLTSMTIPNSVTSIGDEVFRECSGLTSVTIPNSVTSIGFAAFYYCPSLTSLTIPNSVTSIGNHAFQGCGNLTSVTIGSSVTSIGSDAFDYCSSLISIKVESGNTTYDSRNDCNAIIETASNTLVAGCKNTVIHNSVTSIGDGAFYGRIGLTSVTIPNSVTSIGWGAFYDCSGLTSVVSLATTAPTIENNTFYGVKTNGTLTVPSGSSGYNAWMVTGNYYLGKYSWTKIEQ
jgi:hypothetical protein